MELPEYQIFEGEGSDLTRHALAIFRVQYVYNPVYQLYTNTLGIDARSVQTLEQIPFLPIGFFKTHSVMTTEFEPASVFESSGTGQEGISRHYVKNLDLYSKSFTAGFERTYGRISDYCIIGLLPSYLERSNSSLVKMADDLIRLSGHPDSGFYLYDHEKLFRTLTRLKAEGQRTILIGVSFALLDFAEKYKMSLDHTIVIETGGMKGRRKEMIRAELHEVLKTRLGLPVIHAEYGMTELLSQAWSKGEGLFEPVPWMKVMIRNEDDPFDLRREGAGILNIIDLANQYSCSFIATEDVGTVMRNGFFEVSGRVDNSDIRGCSLLVN